MKNQLIGALLVAVVVAAPTTEAQQSQTALSAIEDVEQRFATALDARDRPALEKALTEQFTWVHASDGRVDTREAWLVNAARGLALSGQRSDRSEHGATVQLYGVPQPQTAIRIARIRLVDAANKRESWLRQASRTAGAGRLMFTLGDDGRPVAVSLVRRDETLWRAKRE